jgi:hypothetical protein
MSALTDLAKNAGSFLSDNSPVILTGIGAAGVITTAFLTGKATFKAAEILRTEEEDGAVWSEGLEGVKQKVKLVWPEYIPSALMAGASIGCIVGATAIGGRRQAALVSAYTITQTAFKEYKDKVIEQIGANKEQKVQDEVANQRLDKDPLAAKNAKDLIFTGFGEVWFYDSWSGRYFQSDYESIRRAQNNINELVLNGENAASVNEWYNELSLSTLPRGDDFGWNLDNMLECIFTTKMVEPGEGRPVVPCIVIDYKSYPVAEFWKLH